MTLLAVTGCATRTEDKPAPAAAPACPQANERFCAAGVDDLLDIRLDELKPTQPSLGYDEVYYRLGRYTLGAGAADQLLDQWCATNGQEGLESATPGISAQNASGVRP
jgi:hypothetical protein